MNVYLTFDVELWCDGWDELDRKFPAAFARYVYGRSPKGEYALPATLAILARHGLRAVFFVEPLFSARFGERYLAEIVQMIEREGQDVQLHLHPEWTDEISPPPISDVSRKRQHLTHYSVEEQTTLLGLGLGLLRAQTRSDVFAFRAGSYGANLDTYRALARCGLAVDSSLNSAYGISGSDLPRELTGSASARIEGLQAFPVTVFTDGLGRQRPAQVGACGLQELRHALEAAAEGGCPHFVIVSHNFEMLRPGSSEPDPLVVRRFEGLCRYLAQNSHRYRVGSFPRGPVEQTAGPQVRVGSWPTFVRVGEQLLRRLG